MKWLLRHSEKIKWKSEEWKKSKRGKENIYDVPLIKEGFKIAETISKEIINLNKKEKSTINSIYSSPLTRALQTAIVFQNELYKKTGNFVPIKIEYGLKEMKKINPWENMVLENNKYKIKLNTKKSLLLDNKLKISNLKKKYKNRIDYNYKSIYSFDKTKFLELDYLDGANRVLNTIKKIDKNEKGDNYIVVSHCISMINMIPYYTQKLLDEKNQEKIYGNNWCSRIGINKINKVIYNPK